jgi:hypothetical protein
VADLHHPKPADGSGDWDDPADRPVQSDATDDLAAPGKSTLEILAVDSLFFSYLCDSH